MQAERITELDWWESHRLPDRDHANGRAIAAFFRSQFPRSQCDAMVVVCHPFATARRLFSGDTGLTTEYASIRERGPFDLVMLEVARSIRHG